MFVWGEYFCLNCDGNCYEEKLYEVYKGMLIQVIGRHNYINII